jgi:putative Holliday junction resolvase
MKRILGIDYGERRVGLAVSDELGITAQGLETFDRKTGDLMEHLARLIEEYGVGEVVVGHPLSMSGRPSRTTGQAEQLAGEIESRLGVRVVLWDERLSSAEARRTVAGSKAGRRAGKKAVDRVAAVLILQGYLESRGTADE